MSTNLQKNLAREIVNNSKRKKPLNKKELVISSGYGAVTADRHAPEVIEQKGVQEELEILGFTIENAKKVVSEILLDENNDPNARLKAADQVFKVHGAYAPVKTVNANVALDAADDPELTKLRDEFNEVARKRIISRIQSNERNEERT